MRSLIALIVVLVATAASALRAESHEWYAGLRSPSGMPCCNERDCRPVASRVNHDTGREEILANGAWYPVEYGKVLSFPSPDGGYHACWANAPARPSPPGARATSPRRRSRSRRPRSKVGRLGLPSAGRRSTRCSCPHVRAFADRPVPS
jgi:hypothetical protein